MKAYIVSLVTGVLIGLIYGLLKVRSPAPPVVALVGLLGILGGEQIVPLVKQVIAGQSVTAAWRRTGCSTHMFGRLPGHGSAQEKIIRSNPPEASS